MMTRPPLICPVPALPAHAATLPLAQRTQVWLDFDGTLTIGDFLDHLILRYSRNDSWRLIEERWRAGVIGSRECLKREFDLIDLSPDQLRAELDRVALDPGAIQLLTFLQLWEIPTVILSDGIDAFIRSILARHGVATGQTVEPPTIRANRIRHRSTRLALQCPHSRSSCESGAAHCKCGSSDDLAIPGRESIYVGDGRSDLCASRKAGTVFAKGALAAALQAEGRPFLPFYTLLDVVHTLKASWGEPVGQSAPEQVRLVTPVRTPRAIGSLQ